MALRNILTEDNPALRKVCRPYTAFDARLHQLLDDMADTLKEANGVGLAAPQVGVLKRVVIIDVGNGVIELINPEFVSVSGKKTSVEGCLSVPDRWGEVERPAKVVVRALNRKGEEFEITGEELLATALCHELDHLDGIIFVDKATRFIEPEDLADEEDE